MPTLDIVGSIKDSSVDALRESLLRSYSAFQTYREVFDEYGIYPADIVGGNPLDVLQALPLLQGERFVSLMDESLRVGECIVDLETSSGTIGPRSRRFISSEDDVSDHRFLSELLSVCGIGSADRVACIDVDPVNLMASFVKAIELLGVREAYVYCAGPDFGADITSLRALDPTVIVAIPSIIARCLESLRRTYLVTNDSSLKKVIYFGEPSLHPAMRSLESDLGVEVFGYYGATETSSLGAECSAHDGIHVFTDRNIIEIAREAGIEGPGEIVVTSLKQRTLPLLRYALRDEIDVKLGACVCGLDYPRIEVLGRADDKFSVLGLKINYLAFLNVVYEQVYCPRLMQLKVTRDDRDEITVILPDRLRSRERAIRRVLLEQDQELEFLVRGGYLGLTFSFVGLSYFSRTRKLEKVVDERD